MANLLSKFRLNYTVLKMVSISDKPKPETIRMFNGIIENFRNANVEDSEGISQVTIKVVVSGKLLLLLDTDCQITEKELRAYQEKTHRQLRLRELLLENSSDANLVVM